jgi:hypothetical protein
LRGETWSAFGRLHLVFLFIDLCWLQGWCGSVDREAEVLDRMLSDPCLSDMSAALGNYCWRFTVGDDPSVVGHYKKTR